MIHSFSNGKIASVEEYLLDATLHGKSFDFNHCLNLAKTPISFDNQEVDAFVLDVVDDRLILQLVLPIKEKFDDKSSIYKKSYIRKLLNSDDFLNRFNKEFIEHIKPTKVHTEKYIRTDKLWLLSHEEVGKDVDFLKTNHNCQLFDLFEYIDLRSYSQALLKLNNPSQKCHAWLLRSASVYSNSTNGIVGYVYYDGNVYYNDANNDANNPNIGALCPACTIS